MKIQKMNNTIKQGFINNDRLMKLIYYNDTNALEKANLTNEQKYGLIKEGSETQRIFQRPSNPDVMQNVRSEIRFYSKFIPRNGLIKTMIFFEVIVHQELEYMNNGYNRSSEIAKEIMRSLQKRGNIGYFNFDGQAISPMYFGKSDYYGYILYCTTMMSGRMW